MKLVKAIFEEDFWQLREDDDDAVEEVIKEEGLFRAFERIKCCFLVCAHISMCVCRVCVCRSMQSLLCCVVIRSRRVEAAGCWKECAGLATTSTGLHHEQN